MPWLDASAYAVQRNLIIYSATEYNKDVKYRMNRAEAAAAITRCLVLYAWWIIPPKKIMLDSERRIRTTLLGRSRKISSVAIIMRQTDETTTIGSRSHFCFIKRPIIRIGN